jgi:hypothetical protein
VEVGDAFGTTILANNVCIPGPTSTRNSAHEVTINNSVGDGNVATSAVDVALAYILCEDDNGGFVDGAQLTRPPVMEPIRACYTTAESTQYI